MNVTFKKNNLLFWIFFSSIFLDYIYVNKIYYVFYFFAFIILFRDIWKQFANKGQVLYDKKLLILIIYFYFCIFFISILNFNTVSHKDILKFLSICLIALYMFLKLNIYGNIYITKFYKLFVYIINIFAIINITEILTKKSLFYVFIASDAKNWQTYAFGTNVFRTFSIFEHPIVYAVFLLILFWCNKFLVKNNFIRHLLQLNILLNLFFTKSRSVWIALIITVFIYYFKVIILKLKNYNYKITYKKIFITTFGLAVIIIAGYIFQNQISNIFNLIFERIVVITDDSYGDVSRLQRLGTIKAINYYMTNNGITNFLFGNGIGSVNQFMINNPISISGFTTTDNQYLSIFYNFGFMGLAVYVLIIILSIIKFLKGNIKDINSLSILCFLSVSISMFFFESFGWTDIFIFLTLSMLFISVKKDKLYSKYF